MQAPRGDRTVIVQDVDVPAGEVCTEPLCCCPWLDCHIDVLSKMRAYILSDVASHWTLD